MRIHEIVDEVVTLLVTFIHLQDLDFDCATSIILRIILSMERLKSLF